MGPSGELIVLSRNGEIIVVNPTTLGNTNLTQDPAADNLPTWSPDGSRLVFQSDRDGNQDVWSMNDDGSNPTNLTNHPGSDVPGSWGPCPP
jgi:TolB protein